MLKFIYQYKTRACIIIVQNWLWWMHVVIIDCQLTNALKHQPLLSEILQKSAVLGTASILHRVMQLSDLSCDFVNQWHLMWVVTVIFSNNNN